MGYSVLIVSELKAESKLHYILAALRENPYSTLLQFDSSNNYESFT